MLLLQAISLFAVAAVAVPTDVTERSVHLNELDTRNSTEAVENYGGELSRANDCYSGGQEWPGTRHVEIAISEACDKLQGGYSTGQTKSFCDQTGFSHIEFYVTNREGGRGLDRSTCTSWMNSLWRGCEYGGRTTSGGWYRRMDPQAGISC